MIRARAIGWLALLLLIGGCATTDDEKLDAWQVDDLTIVTVGASNLVLSMRKDNLVADPDTNATTRYFHFSATGESLIISGWFEPDRLFPGVDEHWERWQKEGRKEGLPERRDVQFSKVGIWDVAIYELEVPNLTSTHMFAEHVQAGTWLELHLSSTSTGSAADNRAKLAAFLQQIVVTEK